LGFVDDSICSTLVGLETTGLRLGDLIESQNAVFERLEAQHRGLMAAHAEQLAINERLQTEHRDFMAAYARQQEVNKRLEAEHRDLIAAQPDDRN
jgi:hypothetical protein